jgi:hypothetical protein
MGLFSNLREISAGRRADLRMDVINFRVTIPTSGNITQPSAEKLRNDYEYFITKVRASMTGAGNTANAGTADTQYDDVDEINFNMRESGTGEDLFTTSVELSTLVNSNYGNPSGELDFNPYGHKIGRGADLSITFSRRASSITTARIVVVQLVCVLVPISLKPTAQ